MPKYSTAFGMDVHLRSTTVCALDADTGEAVTRRFPGNPWGEIAGWMDGFPGPSLAAYESGYLGFAPQRELAGLGVECVVAAVSKIPRSAADSASKNDRNDAARMAKAILAHDISPVWVPSPEVEGIRDLAGAYDGATARLATAKQRLLAFLAKRGFVYGGTTPAGNPRKYWTSDFLRWLDKVRPEDDGGVRTLAALRNEVEAAAEARADLLSEYRAAVDASPIAAEVAALQSIKGCAFALAAKGILPIRSCSLTLIGVSVARDRLGLSKATTSPVRSCARRPRKAAFSLSGRAASFPAPGIFICSLFRSWLPQYTSCRLLPHPLEIHFIKIDGISH